MSVIVMYILKCLDIIHQLSTNLTEVVTIDTFPARFPNIFVDYPLGKMRVGNKVWTNWNKSHLRLCQTQLNLGVFWASSACEVI